MKGIVLSFVAFLFAVTTFAEDYKTGRFALWSKPNHKPTGCDIGTALTLDKAEITGEVAFLQEFVDGFCEIAVFPNNRYYELKLTDTDCGSNIYTGERISGAGVDRIRITDHRTRVCRDLPKALIMVEEEVSGQGTRKL